MSIVFLALGANLGDRIQSIKMAVSLLSQKVKILANAPVYETKPVGFGKQENFYNTVVKIQTDLEPEELLMFVKSLEKQMGRKKRIKNGPREIDIDVLLFDDLVFNSDDLVIPHPRMHERDFVLKPLSDIAPEKMHPVFKKTIKELLNIIKKEDRSIISKIS